jgi:hypothetical protein
MNHLINVLYVVAGLIVYDKLIKGMLEKKPEGLEHADEYDGI